MNKLVVDLRIAFLKSDCDVTFGGQDGHFLVWKLPAKLAAGGVLPANPTQMLHFPSSVPHLTFQRILKVYFSNFEQRRFLAL